MAQRSGQTAPSGGYGIWGDERGAPFDPRTQIFGNHSRTKVQKLFFFLPFFSCRRLFFLFFAQALRITKSCQLALMLWIRAGAELLQSDDAMW